MPANLSEFCLLLAVHKRLHSLIVQAVRFDQVYNIEFVGLILASIAHAEVKPLAELLGAPMIELQL